MVFPDGRVVPGAIEADAILAYLEEMEAAPAEKPAETKR